MNDNTLYVIRDLDGSVTSPVSVDNNDMIMEAINTFSFLIPYGEKVTFPQFADLIIEHTTHERAKVVADAIRDTLKMTLIVYKNAKAKEEDIIFKRQFVISNVDASEAYAEKILNAQNFPVPSEEAYSQLKTPEGGNFLSGHLA